MDISKDRFVHFTTFDRAKQIVTAGKLMMRPPYEKFGGDAVYAVSAVWGGSSLGVQTTHIKGKNIVAVVFQTSTKPKYGYIEEVVWDRDVVLRNPKVIAKSEGLSLIKGANSVTGDDMVRYASFHAAASRVAAKFKKKKQVDKADGSGKTTIYEYSKGQVDHRNREKAKRIQKLKGNILDLRKQYKSDLKSDDPEVRLTALAVALMDETCERVGNDQSVKDRGHFGVTTLQAKHVKITGSKATLTYTGKSGVDQKKTVADHATVSALKKALKGKSGTDTVLCEGDDCIVKAKDVNKYLKKYDITAKDIRGFRANDEMVRQLKEQRKKGKTLPTDRKEKDEILKAEFTKALEATAEVVGHESSTLRSQYLVPKMEDSYIHDGTVMEKWDKKAGQAVYSGVFLSDSQALLRWWTKNVGPLHPTVKAHHMTIKFGPTDKEIMGLPVGASVALKVVGYGADEYGQAVVVQPRGIQRQDKGVAHITVAVNGVSPAYSKKLLGRGYTKINGPVLRGQVGFLARRRGEILDPGMVVQVVNRHRTANTRKELHLFDFDGTLFRSPHKPSWWDQKGWWGNQLSLSPPCVPLAPGKEWWDSKTVAEARQSISSSNVWAICCTGRIDGRFRWRVPELLKSAGLNFDEVYLNKGGDTATYKKKVIHRLHAQHRFDAVHVWEDQHMNLFQSFVENKLGLDFVAHPQTEAPHDVDCTPEDIAATRMAAAFKKRR